MLLLVSIVKDKCFESSKVYIISVRFISFLYDVVDSWRGGSW